MQAAEVLWRLSTNNAGEVLIFVENEPTEDLVAFVTLRQQKCGCVAANETAENMAS
jgi:hypothetical protein